MNEIQKSMQNLNKKAIWLKFNRKNEIRTEN